MTEKQNAEMLACPCCAAASDLAYEEEIDGWFITCTSRQCGCRSGIFPTKPMARNAWNRRAAAPSPHPTREEPVAGAYLYEPAERGRLCVIRYKAPHYTGCGDVVARNVELDLAQRIVGLLNAAPPPAVTTREEIADKLDAIFDRIHVSCDWRLSSEERQDIAVAAKALRAAPPPAGADAVRIGQAGVQTIPLPMWAAEDLLKWMRKTNDRKPVLYPIGLENLLQALVSALSPAPQPQEKPECTCGGDPDQPASHHDISCPAALLHPRSR